MVLGWARVCEKGYERKLVIFHYSEFFLCASVVFLQF